MLALFELIPPRLAHTLQNYPISIGDLSDYFFYVYCRVKQTEGCCLRVTTLQFVKRDCAVNQNFTRKSVHNLA